MRDKKCNRETQPINPQLDNKGPTFEGCFTKGAFINTSDAGSKAAFDTIQSGQYDHYKIKVHNQHVLHVFSSHERSMSELYQAFFVRRHRSSLV